jgi:hypothetical protein
MVLLGKGSRQTLALHLFLLLVEPLAETFLNGLI